jgi:2'-5' RNA ligase
VPKRRLGVVLLVPPPWAAEIDGLRRALGDGALGRIAPHLTLVPPVNVREEDVPAALAVLRSAAAEVDGPSLVVRLGPAATFSPENPVVYL